jgi:hypothetical protein
MIVCATPRCGGTIFCLEKARETGNSFVGELSPGYIKGLGRYGDLKMANHETGYQPEFELDDFLSHLQQVQSPHKIYLINESVSLALPLSSFRIATRNLPRAFRSMADLVIRSMPGNNPDAVYRIAAHSCRAQLESNILITRYSQMTGNSLVYYEDIYRSKGEYPFFDAFSQRERLEQFFGQLTRIEGEKLSQR